MQTPFRPDTKKNCPDENAFLLIFHSLRSRVHRKIFGSARAFQRIGRMMKCTAKNKVIVGYILVKSF